MIQRDRTFLSTMNDRCPTKNICLTPFLIPFPECVNLNMNIDHFQLKEIFHRHKPFLLLIASLTLFRLIYINLIPITPQEAYYWYYSLKPDLSYFDHPPVTAYSILLGTYIFGKSIFGVKMMALFWALLTNIVMYKTVLSATEKLPVQAGKQMAFNVIILFNLTIFAHLYSILMVPDNPLIFFWILMIYLSYEYLKTGKRFYLLLTGVALGFGMLSKYTALAILPAIFLIILLNRDRRKVLLKPDPYLALLVAFIIFSPVIYWNEIHDWVSFKFQFGSRTSHLNGWHFKYFLELLASQLYQLTPYVMTVFLVTTGRLIKNWREQSNAAFFFLTGIFILGGFILYSFRELVKMNWLLPSYLGLTITAILLFNRTHLFKEKPHKIGLLSSMVVIILSHLVLLIPNMPLGEGNTWSGWKDTAKSVAALQMENGGRGKSFIFANSYKAASLIKFYLPDIQEVYAQNIFGEPALQFDIWGIPDSLAGKDALYIFSDRREYKPKLEEVRKYFRSVKFVKSFEFKFLDRFHTRTISTYLCRDYHPEGATGFTESK